MLITYFSCITSSPPNWDFLREWSNFHCEKVFDCNSLRSNNEEKLLLERLIAMNISYPAICLDENLIRYQSNILSLQSNLSNTSIHSKHEEADDEHNAIKNPEEIKSCHELLNSFSVPSDHLNSSDFVV
jgi:hypothetical protein